MATSTLIDNIVVNNPALLEDYVDFMEVQEKAPYTFRPEMNAEYLSDPCEIKDILLKWEKNWGRKNENQSA